MLMLMRILIIHLHISDSNELQRPALKVYACKNALIPKR